MSLTPARLALLRTTHRDGRIATRLKGNTWKGPFHLPRMQWYCGRLVDELISNR